MTTWYVTVIYDASKTLEVDAASEEEALEKAIEQAENISLCCECSGHIDLGDPIRADSAWLKDDAK